MNVYFAFVGGWEWMMILGVVILLFGARKLPELARGLGKSIGEFKKGRLESDVEKVKDSAAKKESNQS